MSTHERTRVNCRHVDGEYLLPSHLPKCDDRDCQGCEPCETDEAGNPTRHCKSRPGCTGHLKPTQSQTCPRCIGKVRRALGDIEDLSALMLYAAIEASDEDSEEAMLAGPAADPEARRHRYRSALDGRIPTLDAAGDRLGEDDNQHPVNVLGWWVLAFREDYGQPTGMVLTLSSSVSYLKTMLDKIAQDPEQDWPAFAREIFACQRHLEVVMSTARFTERGVLCPDCLGEGKAAPRRLEKHYVWSDLSGASDYWACPDKPKDHRWTEATYRLRVADDHLEHATSLTAADMSVRLGVPLGTIQRWAGRRFMGTDDDGEGIYAEPKLKASGRSHDGRRLYSVQDATRLAEARARRGA
jgi:hypothetical protein